MKLSIVPNIALAISKKADALHKANSERRPRRDAERKTIITNAIQSLRQSELDTHGHSSISPRGAYEAEQKAETKSVETKPAALPVEKKPVSFQVLKIFSFAFWIHFQDFIVL